MLELAHKEGINNAILLQPKQCHSLSFFICTIHAHLKQNSLKKINLYIKIQ